MQALRANVAFEFYVRSGQTESVVIPSLKGFVGRYAGSGGSGGLVSKRPSVLGTCQNRCVSSLPGSSSEHSRLLNSPLPLKSPSPSKEPSSPLKGPSLNVPLPFNLNNCFDFSSETTPVYKLSARLDCESESQRSLAAVANGKQFKQARPLSGVSREPLLTGPLYFNGFNWPHECAFESTSSPLAGTDRQSGAQFPAECTQPDSQDCSLTSTHVKSHAFSNRSSTGRAL